MPDSNSGCKGYWFTTYEGADYECGYSNAGHIGCEDCIFGPHGGKQDPRIDPNDTED